MYMYEPQSAEPAPSLRFGVGAAVAIAMVATLWLGVAPNGVLGYIRSAPEATSASQLASPAAVAAAQPAPTVAIIR